MSVQPESWEPRCLAAEKPLRSGHRAEWAIVPAHTLASPPAEAKRHALLVRQVGPAGEAQPWDVVVTRGTREAAARALPKDARPLSAVVRRVRTPRLGPSSPLPSWAGSGLSERELSELVPCCAPGEAPLEAALAYMDAEVAAGEPGQRIRVDGWSGISSTFPRWFRDRGYKKKETRRIIAKARAGGRLTDRQAGILRELMRGMVGELREAREIYMRNPHKLKARLLGERAARRASSAALANPRPARARRFGRLAYLEYVHEKDGRRYYHTFKSRPELYVLGEGQVLIKGGPGLVRDYPRA